MQAARGSCSHTLETPHLLSTNCMRAATQLDPCIWPLTGLQASLLLHRAPQPRSALFVTWNKVSASGGAPRLRGCIGTLEPRRLHTALRDYALTR